MVTHYFTLRALVRELSEILVGARIGTVFSQQKNELILDLAGGARHSRPGSTQNFLCISVNPPLNYIYVQQRFSRARKNSVDLFSTIVGHAIDQIELHREDRIVKCSVSNGSVLYANIYNTAASNIILVDAHGIIIEAFKNNKELAGTAFAIAESRSEDSLDIGLETFGLVLRRYPTETSFAALKRVVPPFGSTYAREVLHRTRLSEKTHVGSLDTDAVERLHHEVQAVRDEADRAEPAIYFRGDEMKVLSVIPLQHLSGATRKSYTTLNEAVRDFVQGALRAEALDSEKDTLMRRLKTELERARGTFNAVCEQLQNVPRNEEYDRIGKIIMANLQHLTKGTREVELPDIFGSGNPKKIRLEPQLTPARNAERYFEKAKKAKQALQQLGKQVQELRSRVQVLEKLLLHLDGCHTSKQVQEFRMTYEKELTLMKVSTAKGKESRPPFRIFAVAGGFDVWVGKSSANNDLLTMHHCKPNDLWFHVRGAGGSHTVLKAHGSSAIPSKESILQAARIAAYYSKMRTAGTVPVAYCERKYVRKPKHASPGAVILEREKVVFVKPGLP